MKKRKLNYVIHNPNTIENTTNLLLEILIDINTPKVERAIQEAANASEKQEEDMSIKI